MRVDLDWVVLVVGIIVLVTLCSGDPDLLDAIISWIGRQ